MCKVEIDLFTKLKNCCYKANNKLPTERELAPIKVQKEQ